MSASNRSDFIKLFNSIAYDKRRSEVFNDFVFMASYAIQQSVLFSNGVEQEYMRIVGRYRREDAFLLKELLDLLHTSLNLTFSDFLGSIMMELNLGNNYLGQYFTPYELSHMMAHLTWSEPTTEYSTHSDPACGAGGMLIAQAEVALESGIDVRDRLFFVGVDVDSMAARMAYIQLSLLDLPGNIVIGNTLSMDYRESLFTPAALRYGWPEKLSISGDHSSQYDLVQRDLFFEVG